MPETTSLPTAKPSTVWLPALGWLKTYQPAWLRADLVAALTLAAYTCCQQGLATRH